MEAGSVSSTSGWPRPSKNMPGKLAALESRSFVMISHNWLVGGWPRQMEASQTPDPHYSDAGRSLYSCRDTTACSAKTIAKRSNSWPRFSKNLSTRRSFTRLWLNMGFAYGTANCPSRYGRTLGSRMSYFPDWKDNSGIWRLARVHSQA
jgi:hypothetical protein